MTMDLDEIKRGLRAEIKKRENEQYATFQCNVRQMCKDVLAKLEEQESVIAELKEKLKVQTSIAEEGWKASGTYHTSYAEAVKELYDKNKQLRHHKYKRCLTMAERCKYRMYHISEILENEIAKIYPNVTAVKRNTWKKERMYYWRNLWLKLAEKFKGE